MQDEENVKNNQELEADYIESDDVTFVESDEEGNALPQKDVVKKLRDENKVLRKERDEYLVGWQRMKADYVNLQKDEEAKRKDLKNYVTISLVEDLLPTLDAFDMAFANKEAWEKVDANWRAGVEYIQQQFTRTLDGYGVSKIDKTGVLFDPNLHESVETISTEDESQDHVIAEIIGSGYKMNDRVIRPARVKVYSFVK